MLRDAGFDMDLDGADSFSHPVPERQQLGAGHRRVHAGRRSTTPTGTSSPSPTGEVAAHRPGPRPVAPDRPGGVGVRRPRPAVRHHDQPWHTAARHRAHQRLQPVLGVHAPRQLGVQPGVDQPAASTSTRTDTFDVDGFRHTVEVVFTAQEILVGRADYPTPAIAETSRSFRQLGLGYANLGALLMALGLPYDSTDGRAWAAAHHVADDRPRLRHQRPHRQPHGPVRRLRRQRGAHARRAAHAPRRGGRDRRASWCPAELLSAGQQAWDEAVRDGEEFGVRNSQASVLAPDRHDRPDDGLRHHRHRARPRAGQAEEAGRRRHDVDRQPDDPAGAAPARLHGRSRSTRSSPTSTSDKSILGAPHLAAEHLPVFACSMGDNTIHYEGHVRMMGAVQPFLSGAISKTVNMPEEATVEDVEALHLLSWELGLKAVAIYRDNCKVGQPLSTAKKGDRVRRPAPTVGRRRSSSGSSSGSSTSRSARSCRAPAAAGRSSSASPTARASPPSASTTTAGRARSSSPCPSRARRCRGSWTPSPSRSRYGLQYGVPLRAFVEAFTNMRFEPAGMTDDPDIRFASSIMDYLFRRLALEYLSLRRAGRARHLLDRRAAAADAAGRRGVGHRDLDRQRDGRRPEVASRRPASWPTQMELGHGAPPTAESTTRRPPASIRHADAPMCMQCGVQMIRAGSLPRLPELRQHQRLQLTRLVSRPGGRGSTVPWTCPIDASAAAG